MSNDKPSIFITGGTGNLGTVLQRLAPCIAPAAVELDITEAQQCAQFVERHDPKIIIHAAAYTDVAGAEKNREACWKVNVEGTRNMVRAAAGRRFVYISTEYVFDGEKGMYIEEDVPNPVNFYSLTKLLGEAIVAQYPNTLIIRTAFKPDGPWKYPKAFADQWMSAELVSNMAPDILQASRMEDLLGVIHVSGTRKTVYDLARQASPDVGKMSRADVPVVLPRDTSLDSSQWHKIKKQ